MCLAIPVRIKALESMLYGKCRTAKIQFGSITKDSSLETMPVAQKEDGFLDHDGVAISIVNDEEAKKSFDFLNEAGELDELECVSIDQRKEKSL